MQLLIAGDLVPKEVNVPLFNNADLKTLLGDDLLAIWLKADIRIFNLETPLYNDHNPISKYGPNLQAPISTITGIKALNPNLVTLANNHILDHGVEGLKSTVKILKEHNVPYVGVGRNVDEAKLPYIIQAKNKSIGVYACTEHEFSYAETNKAGANPFDILEIFTEIKHLKTKTDYLVVLYHGGKELYQYPSPFLQKVCRKLILSGADLVVCQHSHCLGSYEVYHQGTIVYGQGNFIFNAHYNRELWNTSVIINLTIADMVKINYLPIIRTKNGVRMANEVETKDILTSFYTRSNKLLIPDFIEKEYRKFALKLVNNYLTKFAGFGKTLRRIDKYLLRGKLLKLKYPKKRKLALRNFIECESHRELLLTGLKEENLNE